MMYYHDRLLNKHNLLLRFRQDFTFYTYNHYTIHTYMRCAAHINRVHFYRSELFCHLYLRNVPLNLIFTIANRGRDYTM